MLYALLEPTRELEAYEDKDELASRFACFEESKTLPFGLVWDMFCEQQCVPGADWMKAVL